MASYAATETETSPLVGVVPAPDAKPPRAALPLDVEAGIRALQAAAAEERKNMALPRPRRPRPRPAVGPFRRLARLWRRHFVRFDPDSIPVCQPLDEEQVYMLERHEQPGYFEQLAQDHQLVTECLQHYNSMHLGDEYEPAPGKVSRYPHFHNGICWTHGNFVAHEPVTEAYSVLGFPLWWSPRRRSGIFDSICKTCICRLDVPQAGMRKTFACGHNNAVKICEMCYHRSHVLHPNPGEFAFGYHHPYHPYPTKH